MNIQIGVEIASNRKVRIFDRNSFLFAIAYIDEQGNDVDPNAIAWVSHENIRIGVANVP